MPWSPAIAATDQRYQWVDLEQISPQAAMAVIASEDQQFPFHAGFDFKSIREAVRHNAHSRRVRGASTISQQVAKNLFLWSGRSYLRKGLEAGFTLLIEWLWPKERILEVYLNIARVRPRHLRRRGRRPALLPQAGAAPESRRQARCSPRCCPTRGACASRRPRPMCCSRQDWIMGQMADLGGTAYLEELERAAR